MLKPALFTLALGLLSVTLAHGAGWERLAGAADDSYATYVFPESVRAQGQLVEAWILDDYAAPQPNELKAGGFYISQETHWLYDCKDGGSTLTEVIRYSQHMGSGPVVDQEADANQAMRSVLARSAASQFQAVCEIVAR